MLVGLLLYCSVSGAGEPLFAHQAARRLLLLRERAAGAAQRPRVLLRQHGPADDPRDPRRALQQTGASRRATANGVYPTTSVRGVAS